MSKYVKLSKRLFVLWFLALVIHVVLFLANTKDLAHLDKAEFVFLLIGIGIIGIALIATTFVFYTGLLAYNKKVKNEN